MSNKKTIAQAIFKAEIYCGQNGISYENAEILADKVIEALKPPHSYDELAVGIYNDIHTMFRPRITQLDDIEPLARRLTNKIMEDIDYHRPLLAKKELLK